MPFKKNIFFNTTRITVLLVLAVSVISLIVLGGWIFDVKILTSFNLNLTSNGMKANAAIGILAACCSLLLVNKNNKKTISFLLTLFVIILGAVTLCEYIFHWNAQIDEFLFKDNKVPEGFYPGRMVPLTAFGLLVLGISLMFFITGKKQLHRIGELLAILISLISFFVFFGYLYNVSSPKTINGYLIHSAPSSLAILGLSLATLFSSPQKGLLAEFYENSIAARVGSRQILYITTILLFIGWLCLEGYRLKYYDAQVGMSVMIASFIVCFFFIVRSGIHKLNVTEKEKEHLYLQKEKSEALFRSIFESDMTSLLFCDANGEINDANNSFLKLVGYSRKELNEGKINWKAMTPPEYTHLDVLAINQIKQTGVCNAFEKEYIRKDGTRIPILIGAASIKGRHPEKWFAYIIDITQRKKTEVELAIISQRLQLATSASGTGVWDWNLATQEITWDETMLKLYRIDTKDFKGVYKTWQSIAHPDDVKKNEDDLAVALKDKNQYHGSFRINWPDGQIREIESLADIIRDENGNAVRMVGVNWDITERKKIDSFNSVLLNLSSQLNATSSVLQAGQIIMDTADKLLRWDACSMELISHNSTKQKNILRIDLIEGNRTILQTDNNEEPITELQKRIITSGPLLLNNQSNRHMTGASPFGDKSKPSLSLMYAPIRSRDNVVGVLSIQSYTRSAYTESDLKLFEILATSCGDVIERINIGAELAASELRYRRVIERNMAGIFRTTTAGKILIYNDAFAKMLGYDSKNELLQKNAGILYFSDSDRSDFLNHLKKDGKIINQETILRHKDGSKVYLVENCYLQKDPVSGEETIDGVLIDISERKLAEQKLEESREKYFSFFEQSADAIFIFDETGHFLTVNNVAADLLGYTKQEFNNLFLSDILFKKDLAANPIRLDLLRVGKPVIRQRVFKSKDGTPVDVEIHSKKLLDGTYLGVVRDITERKKAEEKFRTIIEQASDGILILDNNTQILEANTSICDMLDYSRDHLLNMNLRDIIHPDELLKTPIRMGELREGKSVLSERIILKKNGTGIPVEVSKRLLSDGRIQVFLRNITERKKTALALEKSFQSIRQLTEYLQNIREEERTAMAREIHDELGQQLTVMMMDVSWLDKKIPLANIAAKKKIIELLGLLDNTVKTVRRISTELRPSVLDDLGLIAAMEMHIKEFEKKSGIQTELIVPKVELEFSDQVKIGLFRILQESLTNVARHSGAKKVKTTIKKLNKAIVMTIEDNGIGFSEKVAAKKRTLGVLGMKERASVMGGEYQITGEGGKGTSIIVRVPILKNNFQE